MVFVECKKKHVHLFYTTQKLFRTFRMIRDSLKLLAWLQFFGSVPPSWKIMSSWWPYWFYKKSRWRHRPHPRSNTFGTFIIKNEADEYQSKYDHNDHFDKNAALISGILTNTIKDMILTIYKMESKSREDWSQWRIMFARRSHPKFKKPFVSSVQMLNVLTMNLRTKKMFQTNYWYTDFWKLFTFQWKTKKLTSLRKHSTNFSKILLACFEAR